MAGARLELQDAPDIDHRVKQQAEAVAPPAPNAVPHVESVQAHFQFTGTGQEYFRIWIVNVLLTIVTLGVYSAWAKVRRLRYFYRNTVVDGAIFDYHGKPMTILKGRVLAAVLVLAYKVAFEVNMAAAIGIGALLLALMPWLLARSIRFKLVNSSYRGLRFRFSGTAWQAYKMLSLFPILFALIAFYAWNVWVMPPGSAGTWTVLIGVSLGIATLLTVPYAHFLLKRFQHNSAYYGHTPVFFDARPNDFFDIYWRAIGYLMLGTISAGLFLRLTHGLFEFMQGTMFGWMFTMLYSVLTAYAIYLFVHPYLQAKIQNLVWNYTEIAGIRFESRASTRKLLMIHATNLALVTVTLGLFKPFAAIRVMKHRVESLTMLPDGDLEVFLIEHAGDNGDALGQEAGEFFDIEIAL
jgi:uncharacterized membrane protein YjgN (DUF898 family)